MGEFSRIYKAELSDRQLMAFWALVQASGRDRAIGFDRPAMDGPAFCRFLRRPSVHAWLVAWRGVPLGLCYLTDRQGRSAHVHFCLLPCGTRRVDVPAAAVPPSALPRALRAREKEKRTDAPIPPVPSPRAETPTREVPPPLAVPPPREVPPAKAVRLPLPRAVALFGLASALWDAPEQGFRLDTLIGVTPQNNAPALALLRSLGAQEHGTAPGLCWLYDAGLNVPGVISTFDRNAVPQRAAAL